MIINGNYIKADPTKTILQLAKEENISLVAHCETGLCGFCRCTLKAGKVNYTDLPIASGKENEIFPCVAIAVSDDVELIQ